MTKCERLLNLIYEKVLPLSIKKEVDVLIKIVQKNKGWKTKPSVLVDLVGGSRFPYKAREALKELSFIIDDYPEVINALPKDILNMYKQIYIVKGKHI